MVEEGSKPSVKSARMKAREMAMRESTEFIIQGRFCFAGLVMLLSIRCSAWFLGSGPDPSVLYVHTLCSYSDLLSTCFSVPYITIDKEGWLVRRGFLGMLMSVIVSMVFLDIGTLVLSLLTIMPRPSPRNMAYFEVAQQKFGAWEGMAVASVALQFTLLVCAFRIYKEFRTAGAYPPSALPPSDGAVRITVSPLEIVCEPETVELLSAHTSRCFTCQPIAG